MIPKVYKGLNNKGPDYEVRGNLVVDFNTDLYDSMILSDYIVKCGHTAGGRRPSGRGWWIVPEDLERAQAERI